MTKAELKAKQAFGEPLTPEQQNIIDNNTYPSDYELTPWEALNEQEQEDKLIADASKWGDAKAKLTQQAAPANKIPTFYK